MRAGGLNQKTLFCHSKYAKDSYLLIYIHKWNYEETSQKDKFPGSAHWAEYRWEDQRENGNILCPDGTCDSLSFEVEKKED